ncbi:conserved membrane family protein [Mycobacterium xenopi 3993]|nr:conserved membrane family protein [Mycobacterium xenopi 3993]
MPGRHLSAGAARAAQVAALAMDRRRRSRAAGRRPRHRTGDRQWHSEETDRGRPTARHARVEHTNVSDRVGAVEHHVGYGHVHRNQRRRRAETVVYSVTGEGRAISITYVDDGGVRQTEFNVVLPWSKQVSLPSAQNTASVTIVNIGHDVTCTVTVGGTQVRQRTGVGLTTCNAAD